MKEKVAKPWDFINPKTEFLSEEDGGKRLDICKQCEFFIKTTTQCKKCGCIMLAKTRIAHATCPEHKW